MRLLELELLHRYSTKTYKGFALLSSDEELWQSFAVKEALKFEFLMKEIFALAALHKATEIPESASEYINYALEWKNEALALAHNALQNINQGNSGAVFMFSIMTMIFAIVPPLSVPGITFRSPLENLLVLFEFQKGTASLAGQFLLANKQTKLNCKQKLRSCDLTRTENVVATVWSSTGRTVIPAFRILFTLPQYADLLPRNHRYLQTLARNKPIWMDFWIEASRKYCQSQRKLRHRYHAPEGTERQLYRKSPHRFCRIFQCDQQPLLLLRG